MIFVRWMACAWVSEDDLATRRDLDGDGHDAEQFGGDDCDDRAGRVHPGAEDVGGDGVDADCDGVDGLPPGDSGGSPTGETGGLLHTGAPGHSGPEEVDCSDGVDDDGDGDTDCDDDDCDGAEPCLPELLLNEVLADPPALLGDANCDGRVSDSEDEFVELVNIGARAVDLEGGTLADGVTVRHTFTHSTLLPGEVLLVFGGGAWGGGVACGALPSNVKLEFATTGSLVLDGGGDQLSVVVEGFETVTVWDALANQDVSLVRSPDLDPTSDLRKHNTAPGNRGPFSPGTKVNGDPL